MRFSHLHFMLLVLTLILVEVSQTKAEDDTHAGTFGYCEGNEILDVLIVGAGWAGMGAADHIVRSKANVSFLVLEATDHTGGRSHARKFGKADGPGEFIIEEGSHWISGSGGGMATGGDGDEQDGEDGDTFPNVPTNKIHDLALQFETKVTCYGGSTIDISDIDKVYDEHGNDADPSRLLLNRFYGAAECVRRKCRDAKDDNIIWNSTTRTVFSECGWEPKSSVEWAIDVAGTECSGYEFDYESACHWGSDESFVWWGEMDCLVIDQNPRGYARVLDEMVADTVPDGDPRLVFDAYVVKLNYSGPSPCAKDDMDESGVVTVITRNGRSFRAKEVIVTFPLGVLQRFHSSLFEPSLPEEKIRALTDGGIVMRNVTRVALQFPSIWWDDTLTEWTSANHGANDTASAGHFAHWRNMNHAKALPGSNILYSLFGDPQSSYYEGISDYQVQAEVMKYLRAQHPMIDIPDPTDFFMSRHGYDETRYGAFTRVRPAWKSENLDVLKQPLQDYCENTRIRFAGETMCPELSGYTNGALQSGIEAAAAFLYDHGLGPNPEDSDHLCLCNW